MLHSNLHEPEEERSITLTQLIGIGKDYFFHLLRSWWIILLCALILGGYFFYKAKSTPTYFTAKLTFMLNDNSSGGVSSVAGLLGQFGLTTPKGGPNLSRLIELLISREIIGRALFSKSNHLDSLDYLANHYIHIFKMEEQWRENKLDHLYGFRFAHDSIPDFSRTENSVFKSLQTRVRRGHVSYETTDGEMVILKVTSPSEFMSYELCNALYRELGDYYVEKAIEKQRDAFEVVRDRADSTEQILKSAESRLANYRDSNKNIFKSKSLMQEDRLVREVNLANAIYRDAARNVETARMNLLSATPFIQTVDEPIYPLNLYRLKPLEEVIKGLIYGGLLGTLLMMGIKFVRDLIKREKEVLNGEFTQ